MKYVGLRSCRIGTALIAALAWGCAAAEPQPLALTLELRQAQGPKPIVAAWLEDAQGRFVRTLQVCCEARKWFSHLRAWQQAAAGKEDRQAVDAVVGATIQWGGTRAVQVPARVGARDVLDGGYVIRIESIAKNGQHYQDFKIPIPRGFKGGVFEDPGYVARATLSVAGVQPPARDGAKVE